MYMYLQNSVVVTKSDMPKFPTYRGRLPNPLGLFNFWHYLLLAYWVYFRPTALKCYLYQALPELYQPGQVGFFRRWRNPAYRNLFLMTPTVSLLLAFCLSLPVTLYSSWLLAAPVDWDKWRDGVFFGVGLGVPFGIAFGIVGDAIGGIAVGAVIGAAFSVTIGVLGGLTLSVAFSIAFPRIVDGIAVVGAIFGIASGLAVTLELEIGVIVSLTFGMIGGLSFLAEYLAARLFGVEFGALVVRWVVSVAFMIGAFRGIFYPLHLIVALGSILPKVKHPVEWDELVVLPLPWMRWFCMKKLRQNEAHGLNCLAAAWRNLFCRPALQSVLYRYLHKHPQPLRFLYGLLTNPALEDYMLVPLTPEQWQQNAAIRQVFLGELALRHVEATPNPHLRRSAWWLNLHLFKRPQTPLTRFAGMLHDLADDRLIGAKAIDLAAYREIYNSLATYPDGKEIALSFEMLAAFSAYRSLADLPAAEKLGAQLALSVSVSGALRPPVLIALTRLGRVGADMAAYQSAVGGAHRLAALARATGDLNDLNAYLVQEVMAPERWLLQRIIQQWQQLIMEAIGALGKAEEVGKEG